MAKIIKGDIEATGEIKGATIVGDLTGDVTGTADIATEITVTANNTANETVYLTFVDGATGTQGLETDTALTYNPSTNQISATTSGTIAVQNVTGAGFNNHYIPVVNTFNGNSSLFGDTNLEFNSSTNTLTTDSFAGDLTGGLSLPSGKTITGLHSTNNITITGDITAGNNGDASNFVRGPQVQGAKFTHRPGESVLLLTSIDDIKVVLDEGSDNSTGTFTIHKNSESNSAVFTVNETGIATAGGFTTGGNISSTVGNLTTVNGDLITTNGDIITTNGNIEAGGDITVGDDLFITSNSTAIRSSANGVYATFGYSNSTTNIIFNVSDLRLPNIPQEQTSFVNYYLGVRTLEGGRVYRDNSAFFTGTHIYKAASDIAPGTAVELVNGSVQATSSANSSICVGIVAQTIEATEDNPIETSLGETLTSGWAIKLASVGDVKHRSSAGFLVCNEGGNISPGDLLVTSSTAGYLMKQADDIIRSTTVGKAMEAPSFDENGQASGIYGYIYCG